MISPPRLVRARPAWLVAIFFFIASIAAVAQQDDPSEIFLKAYLSAQQGEKLEQQDRFKTALAKYRFAGSLIEELRKSPAHVGVPIIFLTTESDAGLKQRAKAAGATGWLTKPFDPAQIVKIVKKVLGQ